MTTPKKKCKGLGKAHGFEGCNKLFHFRKFGLCAACLGDWISDTEEGKKHLQSIRITVKKKDEKEKKSKHREQKRELNVSGAMKLADTYFSRYVRLFYSIDGNCTCYTCGKIHPIKEVDNGHYQKREHKATRYHISNCRPQCKTCNGDTKHNGKQAEFRVNLSYEIGENAVVGIEQLARTTIKADSFFFRTTADTYRNKLNDLQKMLKIKYW
jgi:hypothetical protein